MTSDPYHEPLHPSIRRRIADHIDSCSPLFRPQSDESLGVALRLVERTLEREATIESLTLFMPSGGYPAEAMPVLRRVRRPVLQRRRGLQWPEITVEHFDVGRDELEPVTGALNALNEVLSQGIDCRAPDSDPLNLRFIFGEEEETDSGESTLQTVNMRLLLRSVHASSAGFKYEITYEISEALDPVDAALISNFDIWPLHEAWTRSWVVLQSFCQENRLIEGVHDGYDLIPALYLKALIEDWRRRRETDA